MTTSYIRMLRATLLFACTLPWVVRVCQIAAARAWSETPALSLWGSLVAGLAAFAAVARWISRHEAALDELGAEQVRAVDALPPARVRAAIAGSAALSLFLELALIRWQASVWEFFALYKNLSLLSCFAGLGLGYTLAGRDRLPLTLTAPLLAFQMALHVFLRFGPLDLVTLLSSGIFQEQLEMGGGMAETVTEYLAVYAMLGVTFLLTALAFVPVGQLCGRLMERADRLEGYRLNLLGSILGVVSMLGASHLWTPAAFWFVLVFAGLTAFAAHSARALAVTGIASLAGLGVLVFPTGVGRELVYSPYQLIERRIDRHGQTLICASGVYYQRVNDLSRAAQATNPEKRERARYYELPYVLRQPAPDVAIVGAGTGNDAAAALRAGAERVDAIEIDPAILEFGRLCHPERPYQNERVWTVVNDARSFLRSTDSQYDVIAYALLDSHTLLSHAASVRVDSFVYTVEALREARARLKDTGLVSLAFAVIHPGLGRKLYLMMTEAFDGHPPVCVRTTYDGAVIFLQTKRGDLKVPARELAARGFEDATAIYSDPKLQADVSTDDWPFFYMPRRVFPTSYLVVFSLVVALSVRLFAGFSTITPTMGGLPFFFLGAGFMLVETKAITELGLLFGSTWSVIGLVIIGVLTMAYLANRFVEARAPRSTTGAYLLLFASLAAGWAMSGHRYLPDTPAGKLIGALVLVLPMFFSGLVFSTSLARAEQVAGAMAANLLGTMLGGTLESNAMYFGFRSLYVVAAALYALAMMTGSSRSRSASPSS